MSTNVSGLVPSLLAPEDIMRVAALTWTPSGWGAALLFVGDAGIGKSARVEAWARTNGQPCHTLNLATEGLDALGLIQTVDGKGRGAVLRKPRVEWMDTFDMGEDQPRGVLFVDELLSVPAGLQGQVMGLALDKRVGPHHIGDGVRVVAACNPTGLATNGSPMSIPTANRFGIFAWPHSSHHTRMAYLEAKPQPGQRTARRDEAADAIRADEARVVAGWDAARAPVLGLFDAFLTTRPQHGYAQPSPEDVGDTPLPWPSDRSWDRAIDVMTTASILGYDETAQDALLAGWVGAKAAAAWTGYRGVASIGDPLKILDGITPFAHDPSRLDRTMATLSVCAQTLAMGTHMPDDLRLKRSETLWRIIRDDLAPRSALDLSIPAARTLAKARLASGKDLTSGAIGQTVVLKLATLLQAAGVKLGGA